MEQTQIYEYLGVDDDPVFNKILKLKGGQAIDLGGVIISLNTNGLYELESFDRHECFKSISQLYQGVSKYFSFIELHYVGG